MDRWLQKETFKINPTVIKKHQKFHSSYKKQHLTAPQLKVCLLRVEPTLHKPSEMCKKKTPNSAKRRKPTDVYLPVAFTQEVNNTFLYPACILCKIFLQYIFGTFRVKTSLCNKIRRTKNKIL